MGRVYGLHWTSQIQVQIQVVIHKNFLQNPDGVPTFARVEHPKLAEVA